MVARARARGARTKGEYGRERNLDTFHRQVDPVGRLRAPAARETRLRDDDACRGDDLTIERLLLPVRRSPRSRRRHLLPPLEVLALALTTTVPRLMLPRLRGGSLRSGETTAKAPNDRGACRARARARPQSYM